MTSDPDRTVAADPALTVPLADPPAVWPAVPGYDLLGEIARGGMGVVYRARHRATDRIVALKTITADRPSAEAVARFRLEAEAAAALDHPGIVPVYDVGEADGRPYLSMKLVPGGSLASALADPDWSPTLKEKVALLTAVARAVAHAHQRGVIHRDLKPANILLQGARGEGRGASETGSELAPHPSPLAPTPMVADFGLAKRLTADADVTHTGAVLGTPAYMSPEQAAGDAKSATTLSDVYALGVVLYELLTGRRPFVGDTPLAVLRLVTDAIPEPPSKRAAGVPADLDAVCLKCLAKAPTDRYPSADALAADLEAWAEGKPLSVRPPGVAFLMWNWLRQNVRTAVWVVLIGVGCSLAGTAALAFVAILTLFVNAETTYDQLHRLDRPTLMAVRWHAVADFAGRNPWLNGVVVVGGVAAVGVMGLLTVVAVRPRDRWGDLTAGLGVGAIAGVTFALCGGIQATVLALTIVPQIDTLTDMGDGVFPTGLRPHADPPTVRLAHRYPDLADHPDDRRGGLLMQTVVAQQVVGVFEGVWVGAAVSLLAGLALGVTQTMVAGHLVRRRPGWRVLPHYALLTGVCYPPLYGFLWTVLRTAAGDEFGDTIGEPIAWLVPSAAALGGWYWFYRVGRPTRRVALVLLVVCVSLFAVHTHLNWRGLANLGTASVASAAGIVLAGTYLAISRRE